MSDEITMLLSIAKGADMGTVLCVDPSVKALGWAFFSTGEWRNDEWELVDSGVLKVAAEWPESHDKMIRKVYSEIPCGSVVLIELPSHYDSGKGAAARNSGAILKLFGLVMALREKLDPARVRLVPVRMWKGTVPKEITQKRVRKYWDWAGEDHNEADAVGIGDWYLRKGGMEKLSAARKSKKRAARSRKK